AVESDELLNSLSPTGLVNDFAAVFSTGQVQQLEQRLQSVKEQTGAEIAVVTIPTLKDGALSDFANQLFKRWGIGQKGKDNGILIITAINDRKIRIEPGYGLEGLFPDSKTGRIIDEEVIPAFKEGNYAVGLTRAATRIAEEITADHAADTETDDAGDKQGGSGGLIIFVVFIGIIVVFVVLAKKSGKGGGPAGPSVPVSPEGPKATDLADDVPVDEEEDDEKEEEEEEEEEEKPPVFGGGESGGAGAERGW
ncbi:MAG: TPM domain-containing protein, partial [Spartobacteria bacterium]|nr:TPM domain-containing protein [Spartobacteria bacterium]